MVNPNYLAEKLSNRIIYYNPSLNPDRQRIRYGLEWLLAGANQFIVILMIGLYFNLLAETLTCLFGGAILRMFSGGSHFSGYYKCLIFSSIQIFLISYSAWLLHDSIPKSLVYLIVLPYSVILILKYAPKLFKKKHLFDLRKQKISRNISILIIIIYLVISEIFLTDSMFLALWIGVFIQVFSLTNMAELFNKKIENSLKGGEK